MKGRNLYILVAIVLLLLLGGGVFLWQVKKSLEEDKKAFVETQKEVMQEQLESLQEAYDSQYNKLRIEGDMEQSLVIATDSLLNQLLSERNKVDRLKEELSDVRTASAQKIGQLNAEIKTLRTVLKSYVVQIDSLHTANQELRRENAAVKETNSKLTQQTQQLRAEKSKLSDQVAQAAKLDAAALTIQLLDKKKKETSRLSRLKTIAISFIIPRNVTAQVGEKTIYARLVDPTDRLLSERGSFTFEGKSVPFTIKRVVEYNGEDTKVSMYWAVNESLAEGSYRLQLFADGNMIAQRSFELKD